MERHQFVLAEILHVDQPVARALDRGDELVQLQLNRHGVLVLRALDQEHHQEGDDRRAGVDHQLPRVGVPEQRAGDDPREDHQARERKGGRAARPARDDRGHALEKRSRPWAPGSRHSSSTMAGAQRLRASGSTSLHGSRRRVVPARIVEHQHPVQHLARVRRVEHALAGVGEAADARGAPVARVEPPRGDLRAGDGVHPHGERPADRCVHHRVAPVLIARGGEAVAPGARHAGRHRPGDDDRVVGHAREERARLEQRASVLHLDGARLVDRVGPGQQRVVDRLARGGPHLPHGVMAVGVAHGPGEQVPVQRPADVGGDRVAELLRLERDRVVFVDRLAVEHRLHRGAVVIDAGLIVAAGVLGAVPVLPHVDVEPVRFVEVLRRSAAARRVERDQVRAAVALAQAARHGLHDRAVRHRSRWADHRRGSRSLRRAGSASRATRRTPRRSPGVKISGPRPHFLFHLSPQVGRKPT